MFHVPAFYPDMSLKLARVLEEIGVNERMVLKRRRTMLLQETQINMFRRLTGLNASFHCFGSQVEGTTTPGLDSDNDSLLCNHIYSVIQDLREWEPGLSNLLIIQEETTPPGYIMLQRLYRHVPTGMTELPYGHVRYRGDKVLVKNTFIDLEKLIPTFAQLKNGPALTFTFEGHCTQDLVHALPFKTLPEFLSTWLQRQTQKRRLSHDMKRYIESNPCYAVPVGRKDSPFQEAEWRISTSNAEKCLMFNLNITQLQCYILLKLLLKTHLKHSQEKALSSFMCKNILLRCIGRTHPNKWCPQNILSMFKLVILQLKQNISQGYCPHFIIHGNNLMAQKFTPEVKRWLLEKIQFIYETHVLAFLDIEIDDIGNRLRTLLHTQSHCIIVRDISHDKSIYISGALFYDLALSITITNTQFLTSIISEKNSFNDIITALVQLSHRGSDLEQAASCLLTPLFCSSLGSLMASRDINNNHSVSPEALTWLNLGLISDVASSRLKLASVYYCAGDFHATEIILSNIAQMYYQGIVEAVCGCYMQGGFARSVRFDEYSNTHNNLTMRHSIAYCVRFIPQEVHCQPSELQCEMFRSTLMERERRVLSNVCWMDWAVVDSLPYLYFLQYKTYGHLQRYDKKRQALNNLVRSLDRNENYGHKETALNLLGQCYQQENRPAEALRCYMNSLIIRPTNNSARLHICRLLYTLYAKRQSINCKEFEIEKGSWTDWRDSKLIFYFVIERGRQTDVDREEKKEIFHVPRFYHDTSLKLARVLEEIGVNERIILKRRRAILLRETLDNITKRANGLNASHLYFGSQSEGTTTPGLVSDTDYFLCDHKFSVIKDWTEWEPRLGNLLFIQEETTPPGYCMLQVLHTHEPTAMTVIHDEDYVRYSGDKILLKTLLPTLGRCCLSLE